MNEDEKMIEGDPISDRTPEDSSNQGPIEESQTSVPVTGQEAIASEQSVPDEVQAWRSRLAEKRDREASQDTRPSRSTQGARQSQEVSEAVRRRQHDRITPIIPFPGSKRPPEQPPAGTD